MPARKLFMTLIFHTTQKMKKSLMENFIFCAVSLSSQLIIFHILIVIPHSYHPKNVSNGEKSLRLILRLSSFAIKSSFKTAFLPLRTLKTPFQLPSDLCYLNLHSEFISSDFSKPNALYNILRVTRCARASVYVCKSKWLALASPFCNPNRVGNSKIMLDSKL